MDEATEEVFGYVDVLSHELREGDKKKPLISFEVRKSIVTVGRDQSNDIRLNDARVSRVHCAFKVVESEPKKVLFRNITTKGGTFIRSVPMTPNQEAVITEKSHSFRVCAFELIWRNYIPHEHGQLDETIPRAIISNDLSVSDETHFVTTQKVGIGVRSRMGRRLVESMPDESSGSLYSNVLLNMESEVLPCLEEESHEAPSITPSEDSTTASSGNEIPQERTSPDEMLLYTDSEHTSPEVLTLQINEEDLPEKTECPTETTQDLSPQLPEVSVHSEPEEEVHHSNHRETTLQEQTSYSVDLEDIPETNESIEEALRQANIEELAKANKESTTSTLNDVLDVLSINGLKDTSETSQLENTSSVEEILLQTIEESKNDEGTLLVEEICEISKPQTKDEEISSLIDEAVLPPEIEHTFEIDDKEDTSNVTSFDTKENDSIQVNEDDMHCIYSEDAREDEEISQENQEELIHSISNAIDNSDPGKVNEEVSLSDMSVLTPELDMDISYEIPIQLNQEPLSDVSSPIADQTLPQLEHENDKEDISVLNDKDQNEVVEVEKPQEEPIESTNEIILDKNDSVNDEIDEDISMPVQTNEVSQSNTEEVSDMKEDPLNTEESPLDDKVSIEEQVITFPSNENKIDITKHSSKYVKSVIDTIVLRRSERRTKRSIPTDNQLSTIPQSKFLVKNEPTTELPIDTKTQSKSRPVRARKQLPAENESKVEVASPPAKVMGRKVRKAKKVDESNEVVDMNSSAAATTSESAKTAIHSSEESAPSIQSSRRQRRQKTKEVPISTMSSNLSEDVETELDDLPQLKPSKRRRAKPKVVEASVSSGLNLSTEKEPLVEGQGINQEPEPHPPKRRVRQGRLAKVIEVPPVNKINEKQVKVQKIKAGESETPKLRGRQGVKQKNSEVAISSPSTPQDTSNAEVKGRRRRQNIHSPAVGVVHITTEPSTSSSASSGRKRKKIEPTNDQTQSEKKRKMSNPEQMTDSPNTKTAGQKSKRKVSTQSELKMQIAPSTKRRIGRKAKVDTEVANIETVKYSQRTRKANTSSDASIAIVPEPIEKVVKKKKEVETKGRVRKAAKESSSDINTESSGRNLRKRKRSLLNISADNNTKQKTKMATEEKKADSTTAADKGQKARKKIKGEDEGNSIAVPTAISSPTTSNSQNRKGRKKSSSKDLIIIPTQNLQEKSTSKRGRKRNVTEPSDDSIGLNSTSVNKDHTDQNEENNKRVHVGTQVGSGPSKAGRGRSRRIPVK